MVSRSTFPPPDVPVADTIGIARLLAILGIVYVHAWTGLGGDALAATASSDQGMLRWALIELVGRSAVPLLGIISGWLVVASLARRTGAAFLIGKLRTLIVPMLLWNLLALVLVSGAAAIGLLRAPMPDDARWLIDEMTALSRPNHINVQMPFLRDLFVCMLAAPLLVRMPDRMLLFIGATVAAIAIAGWPILVLLRPQILLFFVIGIVMARHRLAERVAVIGWFVALAPFLLLAATMFTLDILPDLFGQYQSAVARIIDMAGRLAAALLLWRIASALSRGRLRPLLTRYERFAFPLFCSHLVVIWLSAPSFARLIGPLGSSVYPLLLIVHPLLMLGAAILVMRTIEAASPALAVLMSGGRNLPRRADAKQSRKAMPATA